MGTGRKAGTALRADASLLHKRALVVDDDGPVAQHLGVVLEREGASVVVAHDVSSAIAVLTCGTFVPDVLVVDLRLPDGDAAAVLESAAERGLALGVVLITGAPPSDAETAARHIRPDRLLLKPVSRSELISAVLDALRGADGRRLRPSSAEPVYEQLHDKLFDVALAVLGCSKLPTACARRFRRRLQGFPDSTIAAEDNRSVSRVRASFGEALAALEIADAYGILRALTDRLAERLVGYARDRDFDPEAALVSFAKHVEEIGRGEKEGRRQC